MTTRGRRSAASFTQTYYDLFDTGEVCPIDTQVPENWRAALIWADGTPSDYGILDWSAVAATMSFQVLVPRFVWLPKHRDCIPAHFPVN